MNAPIVSHPRRIRKLHAGARAQHGIALVVALILLVLITLVGLAAVRGTIMQQKMASNLYDHEVEFQSAEAALREAAVMATTTPSVIWHNCQLVSITCLPNPFNDPNLPASAINTIATGTAAGQYTPGGTATGKPQYVVENMGNWVNQTTSTGFGNTANVRNYGVQGGSNTSVYYRITVRSGDPAKVGDRAVVTIQAVIRQG